MRWIKTGKQLIKVKGTTQKWNLARFLDLLQLMVSNAERVARSHQTTEPTRIHEPKPPDYPHPEDARDPQGRQVLYRGSDGTAYYEPPPCGAYVNAEGAVIRQAPTTRR